MLESVLSAARKNKQNSQTTHQTLTLANSFSQSRSEVLICRRPQTRQHRPRTTLHAVTVKMVRGLLWLWCPPTPPPTHYHHYIIIIPRQHSCQFDSVLPSQEISEHRTRGKRANNLRASFQGQVMMTKDNNNKRTDIKIIWLMCLLIVQFKLLIPKNRDKSFILVLQRF